jgi:uncharacterized protein (TIGR03382 family)
MIAVRFLSGVLLLAAVVLLVSEITRAQLGVPSAPFTSLLAQFHDAAPSTLAALQRALPPLLWDPFLKSLLRLPGWFLLAVAGLLFAWIGRRRRQRVNVFTN